MIYISPNYIHIPIGPADLPPSWDFDIPTDASNRSSVQPFVIYLCSTRMTVSDPGCSTAHVELSGFMKVALRKFILGHEQVVAANGKPRDRAMRVCFDQLSKICAGDTSESEAGFCCAAKSSNQPYAST